MGEYIEREAVIDLLKEMRKDGKAIPWEGKDIFSALRKLPAADVRPVVLCKDCMMRQYCKVAQYLGADGFCSNGEKREES